jgi:NIPSNAP
MENPATSLKGSPAPVVEVRTYRIKPGRRAEFVELFQNRAGPAQRDLGIPVIGPLLDTQDPDVVVWLRAFPSERERAPIKASFYDGPLWKDELEGLVMPMLAEYSAVVCEVPPAFLDGPLRSPEWR